MTTELAHDIVAMADLAERFAGKEITPHVAAWDEAGTFSQVYFGEALAWACQRKTFGAARVERPEIRHKRGDMMFSESTEEITKERAARQLGL